MYFSIIIPVYNRPEEIHELLYSLTKSTYHKPYEILIIEDGSTVSCENVVEQFQELLNIKYYLKYNSGPGDSRNFGMNLAKGDYFLIFDSDCILPAHYLDEAEKALKYHYVDCFGGPDKALPTFSPIQKAINFSMTSVLTTGGIRGSSEKINSFQPRSFNLGISRKAFEHSGGFGNIHPGEDPELVMRLWKLGFNTRLFLEVYVYHKRRINWDKFALQMSKFGKTRPIISKWHPEFNKITFLFPTFFIIGFYLSLILLFFAQDLLLKLYFMYFGLLFIVATFKTKSFKIGYLAVIATWKQFSNYGLGYLQSFIKIQILNQDPQKVYPELFFKA